MSFDANRNLHSLMVAKKMKELANSKHYDSDFAEDMFMLGLVHDIGYEFCNDKKLHNKVGGELLKRNGYNYYKEVYFHGDPNCSYSSIALDFLNTADLMTNQNGEYVSIENRLEDIKCRYGKSSVQYNNAFSLATKLSLI